MSGFALVTCSAASVPPSDPSAFTGKQLPTHKEQTMSGAVISFPERGKVTLVDIWSTSCKPCIDAMPELQSLWMAHQSEGLLVVGVAVDDNPGLVTNKVRELGISYPIVMDPEGAIRGSLHVADLPGAFVVDRAGRVRVFRQGADGQDRQALRDAVELLLAEETQ